MNLSRIVMWIALLVAAVAPAYPREQSATIYFKTTTRGAYEALKSSEARIKEGLLKGLMFVDAKSLDPLWEQRPKMNGWLLFGAKEKEFKDTSLVFAPDGDNTKPMPIWIWIKINCKATEVDTEKIKKLKALISSAIGESLMKEVEITTVYESMFNTRP